MREQDQLGESHHVACRTITPTVSQPISWFSGAGRVAGVSRGSAVRPQNGVDHHGLAAWPSSRRVVLAHRARSRLSTLRFTLRRCPARKRCTRLPPLVFA